MVDGDGARLSARRRGGHARPPPRLIPGAASMTLRPLRIDAHQHFWRYDAAEYGWIDNAMTGLKRDFLPADLRREMDAAGFDASVAVQARQTPEETQWLLALADAHPFVA